MADKGSKGKTTDKISFDDFKKEVLHDYYLANLSRNASVIGRKEVLTGKAKFGIFGAGKEIAQIAMAKAFKDGDFRSGYYRGQTFALASGMCTVDQLFSELYADIDLNHDPFSGGRQMNAHISTPTIDENGDWLDLTKRKNSAADSSPTASQMARAVGIGLATKKYRENPEITDSHLFSNKGNEVVFCNIGDASTSEGIFWESVNAAAVMQIPVAFTVWDDGYGISVPKKYQTTRGSISKALSGFVSDKEDEGMDIYTVRGWDYATLIEVYQKGIEKVRKTHKPALFHIEDVTQPLGHSTSGSHERYKSKERLQWEKDFDPILKTREWILKSAISTEADLDAIEQEALKDTKEAKKLAWNRYFNPILKERSELESLIRDLAAVSQNRENILQMQKDLMSIPDPIRRDMVHIGKKVLRLTLGETSAEHDRLKQWTEKQVDLGNECYDSYLYSQSKQSSLAVPAVAANYNDDAPLLNGFQVLNHYFDIILSENSRVFAFGEDVGKIGDVNQAFAGMQEKYGESRVFDTGIREATIIGQGIGMAMRGLRPIAEIQYLDYLIYGLQTITDDLATLQYRTKGRQKAPLIIRTRGHRLEGIWHTGSPMAMILNATKGVRLLVPRNMTQAAGLYNTMLQSDEPAIIIECLNGYRLKEKLPSNLGEFSVPLGVPEILQEGSDVSLVTYGSTLRIVEDAIRQLEEMEISCELVDVQTLNPFDRYHIILESLKKTNRIAFIDEDVPGGATAFMMQQVIEEQGAYRYLDSQPITITAKEHRAAYASDGDYFSKPNAEDIIEAVYALMHESNPSVYPELY